MKQHLEDVHLVIVGVATGVATLDILERFGIEVWMDRVISGDRPWR